MDVRSGWIQECLQALTKHNRLFMFHDGVAHGFRGRYGQLKKRSSCDRDAAGKYTSTAEEHPSFLRRDFPICIERKHMGMFDQVHVMSGHDIILKCFQIVLWWG